VLQVYERTEPDVAELSSQDDVRQSLREAAEAAAIQDWLLEKVKAADVTVEEEFGTWTVEPTPTVEPPAS
jgi:hypothetical protein